MSVLSNKTDKKYLKRNTTELSITRKM